MKNKGFTIVELMVTISIMIIMTSIVLFNYNKFNESTLLSSFAYDLSLTIRQAQVYGVAARGVGAQIDAVSTDSVASGNFSYAYGVNFDKRIVSPGFPLKLFVDSDKSKTFNSVDGNPLQQYSFKGGIKIIELCVKSSGSDPDNSYVCGKSTLDITFVRPNPEAIIRADGNIANNFGAAKIILGSSVGATINKSVEIYSTGQISVK